MIVIILQHLPTNPRHNKLWRHYLLIITPPRLGINLFLSPLLYFCKQFGVLLRIEAPLDPRVCDRIRTDDDSLSAGFPSSHCWRSIATYNLPLSSKIFLGPPPCGRLMILRILSMYCTCGCQSPAPTVPPVCKRLPPTTWAVE